MITLAYGPKTAVTDSLGWLSDLKPLQAPRLLTENYEGKN
jgi:hypothetical protein